MGFKYYSSWIISLSTLWYLGYLLKLPLINYIDPYYCLQFICYGFVLFIIYLIIYGIGTGNFGTGIRHRSKFVVILIVLAAPKIHKFLSLRHIGVHVAEILRLWPTL